MVAGCSGSKVNGNNDKLTENNVVLTQEVQNTENEISKNFNERALDSLVDLYLGTSLQSNIGLSVGLFYNGKDHFYNYGVTKLGTTNRPNKNNLYEIGSITKTFTSLLLAKAIVDGKLALNDPIIKYLPDSVSVNPDLKKITFKHLANHTSGLPRKPPSTPSSDPFQPYENHKESHLFSYLKSYKAKTAPGSSFSYSNLAVNLLGVLLENIYEKPYEVLLMQVISKPLHLNQTKITLTDNDLRLLAQGHDNNRKPVARWRQPLKGAGSILSSSANLLQYGKEQLPLLKSSLSKSILLTQQPTFEDDFNQIGLGWLFLSSTRDKVMMHSGGTAGYSSSIYVNLSKSIVLVVLANKITEGPPIGQSLIQELSRTH